MKKLFYAFILSTLMSPIAYCEDQKINQTMTELGAAMQALYPVVFSYDKFHDKHNAEDIKENLDRLVRVFEKSNLHFSDQSVSFNVSYNVMQEHLKDTQRVLNQGEKTRAQNMLKAVPSLCVSCHTQDAKNKKYFLSLDRSHFNNDFEYAEFSYVTRDYATAIVYYDRYLTAQGSYKAEENVSIALQRLLTLYAQVDKEPSMAAAYLREYIPYVNSPEMKTKLESWVEGLNEISDYFGEDLIGISSPIDFDTIEDYVNRFNLTQTSEEYFIQDEKENVFYVILRGIIFDYLNTNPAKDEVPKLLYWLAKCDKVLAYNFYYSFAEGYLKECYTKYPDHPYADVCKKELNNMTHLALNP